MPPVIISQIQDALLAAGVAGAATAGGGALAGAAAAGGGALAGSAAGGAGAVAAAAKAAGGTVIQRGLALLAGLALVGGVGGGVLRPAAPSQPLAESLPPAVVETAPLPPVGETTSPLHSEESPRFPETPEAVASVRPIASERSEPERRNELENRDSSSSENRNELDSEDREQLGEDQDPASEVPVEPELPPEVPVEPELPPELPVEPELPVKPPSVTVTPLYQPNPEFGEYLGRKGLVLEFALTLQTGEELWQYPILNGRYGRLEISDPVRVVNFSNYIRGEAPGTCEVRYYESTSPQGPFELAAVVYVTVEPESPITPDYNWGGYQRSDNEGVAYFARTLQKGGIIYNKPFEHGMFSVLAESADPAVVRATRNNQLIAEGFGTTEVRYYVRWAEPDPWQLAVVVQVTVTDPSVPPLPVPPVTTLSQKARLPYGAHRDFAALWNGDLPEEMTYSSSNPKAVWVAETGTLTTLAPGSAVVTAINPEDPGTRYALTVQVEDVFSWSCVLEDLSLTAGETLEQHLTCVLEPETTLKTVQWTSKSPLVAAVEASGPDTCRVRGLAEGTAEVEAALTFQVSTPIGVRTMEETIFFQVHVEAPALPEAPTVLTKEVETFGYCSGYGSSGYFPSHWGEGLPETALTYISSDPSVVYIGSSGFFDTLSAGTAVLTAWDPEAPETQYALTIHVQDRLDWFWEMKDVQILVEESGGYHTFSYGLGSSMRLLSGEWTSSDPDVVCVTFGTEKGCQIQGEKPGSAVLTGRIAVQVSTESGIRTYYDTVSFRVDADYKMETEAVEVTEFGFCSGYGYTGSLRDYFPDLPDGLTFSSRNPSIASIHTDGSFTTLKAGRVLLRGYPMSDSSACQYAVWLNIQDAMDWTYSLEGADLEVGGSVLRGVTDTHLSNGVALRYAYWFSADSRIASVTKDTDDPLLCRVEAKQPGTTMITGWLTIQAPTYSYGNVSTASLSVTVTFPVTVRESEELPEEIPEETVRDPETSPEETVRDPETSPEETVREPETSPEETVREPETSPEETVRDPEMSPEKIDRKPEESQEPI